MWDQISSNKLRSAALIVIFVLLIALIGYVFGQVTDWGYVGLVLALVVAFLMSWGSYWYSDKIVLSISRARPVDEMLSRISSTPWRGLQSRLDFLCRVRT